MRAMMSIVPIRAYHSNDYGKEIASVLSFNGSTVTHNQMSKKSKT